MRYNQEKVEAAKILTGKILELNQKLPENRCVMFEITGILHPAYIVTFCVKNQRTQAFNMERTFTVLLSEADGENRFSEICAYMKKWEEAYCKWI